MTDGALGSYRLSYATVRELHRRVIYAVRVHDALLGLHETDDLASRMRERLAHRGEFRPKSWSCRARPKKRCACSARLIP